jgi:hypothetical protein
VRVELCAQPAQVGLDRGLGEMQGGRDLGVRPPAGDLQQNRALAVAQSREPRVVDRRVRQRAGDLFEQPARRGRRHYRVAGRDRPDRGQQLLRLGVLQQEAAGAGAQRWEHVLVEVERGQDDHPRRRGAVAVDQHTSRLDAVEPGHADVHQHDVGGGDREPLERLAAVLRFADHGHVGLGVDHHPQTGADERLVVG